LVRSIEAGKIKDRLHKDDEQSRHIGDVLYLTLEKVTSLQKPVMLAKVFSAYLDEVVDADTLQALAHAIDIAFVSDLEYFLQSEASFVKTDSSGFRLLPSGLIQYTDFQLTPLGEALLLADRRAQQ
jgi:hypothetical protein